MTEATDFDLLLAAARSGDEAAMQRLIQQYEPELRIVARHRLGPALRPHLDTMDLVQSVHRSLMIGLIRVEACFEGKGNVSLKNLKRINYFWTS